VPKRRPHRRPLLDDEDDDLDPVAVLAQRLLETPQIQNIIGSVQYVLDRAGDVIDDPSDLAELIRERARATPPTPRPRPKPRRPRAPRPKIVPPPPQNPRAVLHFGPKEPLDKSKINKRRRALAALCHPDQGGSTEAMQKINEAADQLLTQV
jgi:hypothetical protein